MEALIFSYWTYEAKLHLIWKIFFWTFDFHVQLWDWSNGSRDEMNRRWSFCTIFVPVTNLKQKIFISATSHTIVQGHLGMVLIFTSLEFLVLQHYRYCAYHINNIQNKYSINMVLNMHMQANKYQQAHYIQV